jgi:hypothetical protein
MNIQEVIAELRNETKRLDRAIAALERLDHPKSSTSPTVRKPSVQAGKQTVRGLTVEGRKRLSESMKQTVGRTTKEGLNVVARAISRCPSSTY